MSSTSPATAGASGSADKIDKQTIKVAGVVVLGAIMSILDVTVVSVALPTFQEVFDATLAQVAWTMTAYTLALGAVIPITGWAADRFGTKRLYLLSLVLFTLGSVLCSLADSVGTLVAFRVVQGIGGGMLLPLGMTMLTRAAGPERVGRVMAILGIPMLLGPIGGPILGGWLIEAASWHWIFLINLPIGIIALVYAAKVLPKDVPSPSESFDFLGMALLSPGLALLLFGVSSIPEEGTVNSTRVIIPAVIGLLLVVAFVFHALRKDHPLIDLRLFRSRNLSVSVITMSLFAIAFFGAMLLFPSYFLQVRGETTLAAGLLLAPQGIGAMLTMPIAGALTDKMGPGKFVLAGITLIAIGMGVFTQIGADTSYVLLLGSLFVMGMGMGMTMMPIMSAALASLTSHDVARGSTLMNIVQQTAGSIGTAVMSVILTNQLISKPAVALAQGVKAATDAAAAGGPAPDPELLAQFTPDVQAQVAPQMADSFGFTFVIATILIVLCLVPALFLPRKKLARPDGEPAGPVMMH